MRETEEDEEEGAGETGSAGTESGERGKGRGTDNGNALPAHGVDVEQAASGERSLAGWAHCRPGPEGKPLHTLHKHSGVAGWTRATATNRMSWRCEATIRSHIAGTSSNQLSTDAAGRNRAGSEWLPCETWEANARATRTGSFGGAATGVSGEEGALE